MSLAELAIKRPIFITCLVLAMIVVGIHLTNKEFELVFGEL